jgi:hypothetical protein
MNDTIHNMSGLHRAGNGKYRLEGDSVFFVDFEYYSILSQILFGVLPGSSTPLRLDSKELPVGSTLSDIYTSGMGGKLTDQSRAINVKGYLVYGLLGMGEKQSRYPAQVFRSQLHSSWEVKVNPSLERILGDPSLGLTATARIILLYLPQSPSGSRIEDIALSTGSKYRWVENKVLKLARSGILRRVGPNAYAINTDREVPK